MTPGSSQVKKKKKAAQSHSPPSGEHASERAGGRKQECDRLRNGPRDQDRWREEAPSGCINLLSSSTVTLCCTRPGSSSTPPLSDPAPHYKLRVRH